MDRAPLSRYDFYKGPQLLGEQWTLKREALLMRCTLYTHTLGWELKLTAGASFSRSQVCKTETDVFRTSDAWLAEAKQKGFE